MEYRIATANDIEGVLSLHSKYHIDTISDKDKSSGFVTTPFDREILTELINKENGLFVALDNEKVIAYVMSASWDFCSRWPMFQYMIKGLNEIEFLGQKLNTSNSYQYGPICIDSRYRGSGVLENIFESARNEMNKKYPILVTFINKINPRSVKAHIEKLGLTAVMDFEYNNNSYVELVYDASIPLKKKNIFPEPIRNLPRADIPLEGLTAYLSQAADHQILYMHFEKDAELPEHAHSDQTGFVLEGRIDLIIDGVKQSFKKGERYHIPKGIKHSASIYAGYADITVFMEADRYNIKK